MTINIDLESMRQAVADVVVEHGADTVYRPETEGNVCVYEREGEASCLIGKALFKLGVPLDVLSELDADNDDASIGSSRVRKTLEENDIIIESDAQDYAEAAQSMQDAGKTWGAAFEGAEAWISRNG